MRLGLFVPSVCIAVAGCGATVEDDHGADAGTELELAVDTSETARSFSQGSALTRVFLLGLSDLDDDGALAAKRVLLSAKAQLAVYLPAGCATLTSPEPAHVRVRFDGCHGPFGLLTLDGELEAIYQSRAPGQRWRVHVQVPAGATLTANGRPIEHSAEADVAVSEGERRVVWHASSSGTSRKGEAVTHASDMELRFDLGARCVEVSGVTRGAVGARGLETLVDGYVVCADACPSGGTITSTGLASRRAVTLRFDGSSVARGVGRNGRAFQLPLACAD